MSTVNLLIGRYLEGPGLVRRSFAGLSPEQLRSRPVPGKWSTLEVVCHVVESDQVLAHRMKRVIAEDRPLLPAYDETRFTDRLGYHDHVLEDELALLELVRRQTAGILRRLPEDAWERAGVHTQAGLVSLRELLGKAVDHVQHHVRFIDEKRRALGIAG
jgi:hypothetical protein